MGMPDSGESLIATLGEGGAACLCIDRVTGDILDCNQAASALLRIDACSLRGMRWSEAICCEADQDTVLAQLLAAGVRSSLPPFLIRRVDDREVVVAGVVLPWEQGSSLTLILWQLLDEEETGFTITAETSDTVAILGLDQLRYDLAWGAAETRRGWCLEHTEYCIGLRLGAARER